MDERHREIDSVGSILALASRVENPPGLRWRRRGTRATACPWTCHASDIICVLDIISVLRPARVARWNGMPRRISFDCVDIRDTAGKREWDVLYARFLLTHLSDPAGAVSAFCDYIQPGGLI